MRDPTSDVDLARRIIDFNPDASSESWHCKLQNYLFFFGLKAVPVTDFLAVEAPQNKLYSNLG